MTKLFSLELALVKVIDVTLKITFSQERMVKQYSTSFLSRALGAFDMMKCNINFQRGRCSPSRRMCPWDAFHRASQGTGLP